ncbi:MAG: FMN-binding negative transcriptional regulator [Gallionella sp.]|nr:FMN-binding negative transcriptional regulator [Gallionella sp.]MDD4947167.1 FMN-binding negative transcriptional regulator [Gallionella sp.]MDD5612738.1 FMN-binding negative transcriptional regulator [Gallionella sp.]
MYIPAHFAETDLVILHDFMRQNAFATLVTSQDGVPSANHLPMMLDVSKGTHGVLVGHMARNNPQWQTLATGAPVLAIFQGAHAYISPAWYEKNAMNVPTWNFMAVHAYGVARILSENELVQALYQLTDENEKSSVEPWKLELTQEMRERMLGAIVGFEITLNRVEGKFKMSQNRSQQDQCNIVEKLLKHSHGKEVAHWMSKALERK